MSFWCLKQGQVNSLTLFYATEVLIETHLADSLFADRRWHDGFAAGAAAERLGKTVEESVSAHGRSVVGTNCPPGWVNVTKITSAALNPP
jgi:hypothetical protein